MSGQRAAFQTVEQEDVIPRGCKSWQICLGISLSVLPQWVSPLHCYISLLYLSILCIHSFHSRIHTYTKTMRISRLSSLPLSLYLHCLHFGIPNYAPVGLQRPCNI